MVLVILTIVTALIAPTWLAWWNSRITRVNAEEAKAELKENGGSSTKDQVKQVNEKLDLVLTHLSNHDDRFELMKEQHEFLRRKQVGIDVKLDAHILYMNEVHSRKSPTPPEANQHRRHTEQ